MKLENEKNLQLNVQLKVSYYTDDNGKQVKSYRVVVPIDAGFTTLYSELIIPKEKKELKQYFDYLSDHEE